MRPDIIKMLDHIIKINQRVASSVGQRYVTYLGMVFTDIINVYKNYSQCISQAVNQGSNESMIKPMKALRRDILKLLQTYIEKETDFT